MSRLHAFLAAFAILAAALFANLLLSVVGFRADLTEDRTFTLSPGSRRIVAKLDEPVTLELFVSRSDVKLRPYLESYSRRVETLLREYVAGSGGKVRLVVTDPRPDTKEEQRAQRHGLAAMRMPQGSAYLGLTAQQADTVKAIPALDPSRERFLEYDLSKLIASASRLERPKLAFISSLPITNEVPPGSEQQAGPADFLITELGQTFEVVTVTTQATELPKNTAVVALVHTHHMNEKLAYAVDQFLLRGGPVFAAVDPLSRIQKFQQGNMPFMMAPMALSAGSDPAMFRAWGVNVEIEAITGDAAGSVAIRSSRGDPVQYPPAIAVGPDGFVAKDSPLTSNLRELAFMEAGDVSLISGAEARLKLEPLVVVKGPGAGAVGTIFANAGPFEKVAVSFKPDGRARTLVAMVTGTFTTAFPKGAPADAPAADGKKPADAKAPAAPAAPHLAQSAKPGRLFIVADSDFMMDPFTVRARQFGGQQGMEAINDNLSFVVNSLETLGGSDELVGLRSKGTSIRPFKVVAALEREAQMRYQAKLDEIEKKLEEANNKISELSRRSGADPSKGLIITPEMQREIDKFQAEADRLGEERRVIRRGLSEDVNSLGRRLQVINLLAGPSLAVFFGLCYALLRRRKLS